MRGGSLRGVLVWGSIAALAAVLVSLAIGDYPVPIRGALHSLGELLGIGQPTAGKYTLVVNMRLTRAVGALCVGGCLGIAGCMLQSLLRNPLASPFVIGTAQGAGFGAVLAIFLRFDVSGQLAFAFVMSVVAAYLVISLARTQRSLPTESVVLTGISMSLLFTAANGLMRYLSHDRGVLSRMALWLLGGLWHLTWGTLAVLGPLALVSMVLGCIVWRRLDLLALGEEDAARLGLRTKRVGTYVLLLSCILTSVAVCLGGVVAFVGLIVPHAARKLVGPAHAALLPASAFLGGILVIATDDLARTAVPPQELPLAVVTSLIGVPAFLILMRSLRARRTGL